jgi:cysteinyl-tRNA synthetase
VGDVTPFRDAMDDDFDTPAALAYVFELVRDANVALDEDLRETAATAFATVQELAGVLGIEVRADAPEADAEIEALVAAREAARHAKDWAEADRIRAELSARGIVVEDTPRGPEWRHE